MKIEEARIIDLPKFLDARGNLSFAEEYGQVPFRIERTYWIYDVPGGEKRGGHAYRENREFIIALSGSFDVVLDDGRGLWREMDNFSTNSLALVLSSTPYEEDDYIYDYDLFKAYHNE